MGPGNWELRNVSHHPAKFDALKSGVWKVEIQRFYFVTWNHGTEWSNGYGLGQEKPLTLSHHPTKFCIYRSCGTGDNFPRDIMPPSYS